jgi:hypothetical protein
MANSNSSEIITHLRTVHFFLVVACILVLISVLASPSSDVKTAHDQLQKVLSIRNNWNIWTRQFSEEQIDRLRQYHPTWPNTAVSEFSIPLEESRRAGVPQGAAGMLPRWWTITPLYSPVYLYFMVDIQDGRPQRHEILSHGYLKDYGLDIIPGGLEAVGSPTMDTLDQFRRLWNSSNTIQAFIVTEFSKVMYIVANGHVRAELRWDIKPKTVREGEGPLYLERRGVRPTNKGKNCDPEIERLFQSQWSTQFNTFFCAWIPYKEPEEAFVLLANGRDYAVSANLPGWLAKPYDLSMAGRTFEEQFSVLHRVTKDDYQELELRKVERILGAELQRSGDRVEFLGLKFPERLISAWGLVIIVAIQLYFYLHLHTFRSRLTPKDPGLDLAWIGLYPDHFARVISLVSVSVLPLGVTSYLAYLVIQSYWSQRVLDFRMLYLLGLWISGLWLACGSFKLIWDLTSLLKWRRRDLSW